jgi:hypothetical protein
MILVSCSAMALPKKAPSKPVGSAPEPTISKKAPPKPSVAMPVDGKEALQLLETLYKTLEYDQVIPLADALLAREDLSTAQRLEVYRLQGSARAIVEDPIDAERPFRLLLRARPDYDLPSDTPPKILAVFRKVQTEEKALAAQLKEVERTRVIQNLRLSGEPAKEAVGGRPIRYAYRLRDTAGAVESIRVQYRRAGQKAYSSLALERSEDGEWRGLIPGEFTADPSGFTLEYVTETSDREGPLLTLGTAERPLMLQVSAGAVPVQAFKPVPKSVFFTSVGVTVALGAATGVMALLLNREQTSFNQAVRVPNADGALLAEQIRRGDTYALSTNVLLIASGIALAATLILLPLTRFFEE